MGLYSRVALTGEELDQHIADSLKSVEWTKQNRSGRTQLFTKEMVLRIKLSLIRLCFPEDTLTSVLGLCIMFYCLYKYHHSQRVEKGRTTDEGDADNIHGIYQVMHKQA